VLDNVDELAAIEDSVVEVKVDVKDVDKLEVVLVDVECTVISLVVVHQVGESAASKTGTLFEGMVTFAVDDGLVLVVDVQIAPRIRAR